MRPLTFHIWLQMRNSLFGVVAILVIASGLLMAAGSSFFAWESLKKSLTNAGTLTHKSLIAGDWDLAMSQLQKTLAAENLAEISLYDTSSGIALLDVRGESGGWMRACLSEPLNSSIDSRGCAYLITPKTLIGIAVVALMTLLVSILFFFLLRRKAFSLLAGISQYLEDLKSISRNFVNAQKSGGSGIEEIENVRTQIVLLLEEIEALGFLKAKEGIVKQVAHDLRGPLLSMKILLQQMPKSSDDYQILSGSIERVEQMLRELLKKNNQSQPLVANESRSLAQHISSSMLEVQRKSVSDKKKINFVVSPAIESLLQNLVLPERFRRVFWNILMNSYEAIEIEGSIRVEAVQSGDSVTLTVTDDGKGVPPELMKHIGTYGFSTKGINGNGLGLHDAKEFLQSLGGDLKFQSVLNVGSSVSISLPNATSLQSTPPSRGAHPLMNLMIIASLFFASDIQAAGLGSHPLISYCTSMFRFFAKRTSLPQFPEHGMTSNGDLTYRKSALNKSRTSRLVLAIPGGPGIDGSYLDSFAGLLASDFASDPIVIDLPNHGRSYRGADPASTDYSSNKLRLEAGIAEIIREYREVVLVGHSLGAFLALNVLSGFEEKVQKIIVMNTPVEFGSSPALTKAKLDAGINAGSYALDSESGFQNYWRDLLPLYFSHRIKSDVQKRLSEATYWIGNENFLKGHPTLAGIAERLSKDTQQKIVFIQSAADRVAIDGANAKILRLFPNSKLIELNDAGHFPMIEAPEATRRLILAGP